MRIFLTSLGCKLNQAEIESLARQVVAAGHVVMADPAQADWAIINTCTVTHIAARKSRQALRQLRRANPSLRLAVTGCYADMETAEVATLEGVALIVPNADKEQVVQRILAQVDDEPQPCTCNLQSASSPPARLPLGHTRAFVKIQDGCDNRCAYCIVSTARGPQRSRLPEQIMQEVRTRVSEGYKEVVLSGVNIGAYGCDSAPGASLPPAARWSLARLVRLILEQTTVPRLRLSSIEPWDLTPELLDLWPTGVPRSPGCPGAAPLLCRHLHLPLQSGCDATLQRMRRRYTTAQYVEWVAAIRHRVPEIALTTDVIVGFPGETESEFAETLAFVRCMAFSRLHVFKYSRRAGTRAATLPEQVPAPVSHQRSETVIAVGRELALAFHRRYIGQDVAVLLESAKEEDGVHIWDGLTDNYLRVRVPSDKNLANTLITVRCMAVDEEGLRGASL